MWRPDPRNWRISKGPGGTQRNREKWRGAGCVYLAQREIPGFSDHSFSENEKENLSMAERNAPKKRADSIFETYGR
jgi:hypothetical protein